MKPLKIKELRLRHYRAFSDVRLELDKITYLVGKNGAGKSTLMDGLSFLSEAVTDSLSTALERRGNLEGVRQRQPGRGTRFDVSVAVVLESSDGMPLLYGFKVGTDSARSSYVVKYETLFCDYGLFVPSFDRGRSDFGISAASDLQPTVDSESLVFPLISSYHPQWKAVAEALRGISVHQFSPQAIRGEPKIGTLERLSRDGSNAGDVLKHTKPRDREWIEDRLAAAVPGIKAVRATSRVGRRVVVFEQAGDAGQSYEFDASMMSDGTVRSLGVLLALRQTPRPSIVLLDEIEDSLHPYAHGVLLDAIAAASEEFPVVVSTHNPEILSHPSATGERVRIVQWHEGTSRVFRLSENVLANLKPPQTVGRLLRSNALWTEPEPATTGAEADFFRV